MNKKILFVLFLTLVLLVNGWTQARLLKRYTEYETSLTREDIMRLFVNEVRTYLQQYDRYGCYYLVNFEVLQDSNYQNIGWNTGTYEDVQQRGTVYHQIFLSISNADLIVTFSNISFSLGGQSAREIVTTRSDTVGGNMIREHIVNTANSMFNESEMVLKMNNRNYSDESKAAFLIGIIDILF